MIPSPTSKRAEPKMMRYGLENTIGGPDGVGVGVGVGVREKGYISG